MVMDGKNITARQYYEWLGVLFLSVGAESVASLHNWLSKCKFITCTRERKYLNGLPDWHICIFTQLRTAGAPVPDLEMKHSAMSEIYSRFTHLGSNGTLTWNGGQY